ncbi:hypothetical protein DFQ28_007151 [Apophysomyces sp. BC1034]|nr:hypothetical protein DFQ30_006961 [Apophysomyces sp. BC1015]KAG0176622.1 hypothetical protein DFQ29_005888 [Apophysomyces sp. BC1021]KAG0186906.1 hypothetical protein DFQ28_007151 [Apophysomyces sp. BC1034]
MAGHYVIAGKAVPNHLIAIGFITAYTVAGVGFSMRPKAPQPITPPIKASSTDEEEFIRQFLKQAEADEKK